MNKKETIDDAEIYFINPWVDGTTSMALVYLGQMIEECLVSANPPQRRQSLEGWRNPRITMAGSGSGW